MTQYNRVTRIENFTKLGINMKKQLTKTDQELLKNRLKVEWTHDSTAIEGNNIMHKIIR